MAFSIGRGTLLGVGYIRVDADTGAAEEKMGLLGKGLGVAAVGFTAVTAAAAGTVMVTSQFNSEMLKTQTQAGASAGDVKILSSQILGMKNVQQVPDQLAESMYHLKSIGLDNVHAMTDLRVASNLAAVGGSNLEDTTNALGGAWRSGIKGAETFAKTAGTVNAVIGAGNMRMGDFVAAIGTGILPAAKTFGVSLTQVGAALALMTDEGVPATDAATRLKMSFSLLAAPSNVAEKQLSKIGLTGLQMAETMRGPSGLVGTIQLLKDHLDASGLSASKQAILLSRAFGGGRSSSAILTMLNNVDVLHGKLEQINKTAGNLPAAIAAQQKTLAAQLKIVESGMESTAIRTGTVLIGPVTLFVTFLNSTLLPALGKVTSTLRDMVPVDKIKSDLGGLAKGLGSFFSGVTGSSVKDNVSAKVSSTLSTSQLQAFTGARQGPGKITIPTVKANKVIDAASSQIPGAGLGQSNAQRLQVPTGPVKMAADILPPPDTSAWTKAGVVVKGVIKDVEDVILPVGRALLTLKNVGLAAIPIVVPAVVKLAEGVGKILMPALVIVGTYVTSTVVPVLFNLAKTLQPLGGLLLPLAAAVGVTLYGALQATGFLLNSVIGPALVATTKFMSDNRALVAVLAGVFLLLNAQLVISRIQMVAGAVGSKILAGWNLILSVQTKAVAIATKTATIATKAWAIAQGLGSKAMSAAVPILQDTAQHLLNAGSATKTFATNLGTMTKSGAKSAWSAITTGASAAGNAMKTAGSNAKALAGNLAGAAASGAKSAWTGLTSGAAAVGGALSTAAKASWEFVASAAAATGAAIKQAASFVIEKAATLATAAAEGIMTAAQWLLNLAMDVSPIGLIVTGIGLLVGAIIWVATKTDWFQVAWRATWGFVKKITMDVFDFLTKGFGQLALLILGPIGVLLLLALHWKEVWSVIQTAASDAWNFLDKWVIKPIASGFSWLWTNGIQPAMRFIVVGFLDMVGTILHGAASMLGWVPGIGGKLKNAAKAFDVFKDSVNSALGGIQPKVVPVTVSFNGVPEGRITGHTYTSTTGFSYAQGGQVPGDVGTPHQDSVLAWLTPREFVVNEHSTAKHLDLLKAINSGDPKKYAKGGMVGFAGAAVNDMTSATQLDIAATVKKIASSYAHAFNASHAAAGLGWARTQVGMPYQWGGDGNPSWDCSGFMSAIESVMRGQNPHRRWATGAFSGATAPPGWVLDAKAPFMIGVTNAGVGHTAGTLLGTNVEMSTVGGRVGGGARGASDPLFPSHYGLVGFDRGGWLQPGVTMAYNGTGKPERVVGPQGASGSGDIHVHLENHGVIGSQREMNDWLVSALTDLQRKGRLRGLVGTRS